MSDDIFYSNHSSNHHYTVTYKYGGIFPDEYYIHVDGEYEKTVNSEREMHEEIDQMIEDEE